MTRRPTRRLSLAVVVWLVAAPARALPPSSPEATPPPTADANRDAKRALQEAQERYERALQLYDDGALDAALLEFKRAYALAPTFRILYNLGVVSLELRDYANALDFFERYLAGGGESGPEQLRSEVTAKLPELAARVGWISIRTNVPGAEISIDDRPAGIAPLPHALRVNAGTRRIGVRAPGWLPRSGLVELAGADRVELDLALVKVPELDPTRTTAEPPSRVPWVGWAGTAVLAGGAVFSGLHALSLKKSYDRERQQLGVTASELDDDRAQVRRWSIAADALAISALALGGYCIYFMLDSDHGAEPSSIGQSSYGVWISGELPPWAL